MRKLKPCGYSLRHSLVSRARPSTAKTISSRYADRHKGALDSDREEFLFLSVKEILSELAERAARSGVAEAEPADAKPNVGRRGRMLCIPASDEADEVAAAMLALLLEQYGCVVLSFMPDLGSHQLAFVQPVAERYLLYFRTAAVRVCPRQDSQPSAPGALSRDQNYCGGVGICLVKPSGRWSASRPLARTKVVKA